MTYDAFDVVVVPFPFSDRSAAKRRPALVLSSARFNGTHDHVVLAMITSSQGRPWPSDVIIEDWRQTRLTVPCVVRFKVFTLDRGLILRRIGPLSPTTAGAVAVALATVLGPTEGTEPRET